MRQLAAIALLAAAGCQSGMGKIPSAAIEKAKEHTVIQGASVPDGSGGSALGTVEHVAPNGDRILAGRAVPPLGFSMQDLEGRPPDLTVVDVGHDLPPPAEIAQPEEGDLVFTTGGLGKIGGRVKSIQTIWSGERWGNVRYGFIDTGSWSGLSGSAVWRARDATLVGFVVGGDDRHDDNRLYDVLLLLSYGNLSTRTLFVSAGAIRRRLGEKERSEP